MIDQQIEIKNFKIEADSATQYSGEPGAGMKAMGTMDIPEIDILSRFRYVQNEAIPPGDSGLRLQIWQNMMWHDINEVDNRNGEADMFATPPFETTAP